MGWVSKKNIKELTNKIKQLEEKQAKLEDEIVVLKNKLKGYSIDNQLEIVSTNKRYDQWLGDK